MAKATCLFLLLLLQVVVRGDYRVVVQVTSYDNPTNRCEECGQVVGLSQTCCDAARNDSCTGNARCDNIFSYCLRELGAEGVEPDPPECDPMVTTERNMNGGALDFNQSTVLGLPNPLPLMGLSLEWEGIQLYIEVQDFDNGRPANTIDIFLINIPSSFFPGELAAEETYRGFFNWAEVTLSYRVECLEGYTGELCDVEDHCIEADCGSGECINEEDGFTCLCPENFLGEYCETRDNCFGVDCENGECENQEDSFTCVCDQGYMGQFCRTKLSNNPGAAIGGGVVGVVIFLLLLATGICICVILIRRMAKNKRKPTGGHRAEELEREYMFIKKQPLAINNGEIATGDTYSRPVKKPPPPRKPLPWKPPPRKDDNDVENSYAVPDTASMRTHMTVNIAYGHHGDRGSKEKTTYYNVSSQHVNL